MAWSIIICIKVFCVKLFRFHWKIMQLAPCLRLHFIGSIMRKKLSGNSLEKSVECGRIRPISPMRIYQWYVSCLVQSHSKSFLGINVALIRDDYFIGDGTIHVLWSMYCPIACVINLTKCRWHDLVQNKNEQSITNNVEYSYEIDGR